MLHEKVNRKKGKNEAQIEVIKRGHKDGCAPIAYVDSTRTRMNYFYHSATQVSENKNMCS